jgi:hypothetical protein
MSFGVSQVQPLQLSFLADPAMAAPAPALTIQPLSLPSAIGDASIYGSDLLSIGAWSEPSPPSKPANIGETFMGLLRRTAAGLFGSSNNGSFWRNPIGFFVTQYKSAFNKNEDVAGNGNCGPTSLTMCAMAFGKISVNAQNADAVIEQTRKAMTGKNSEKSGTSFAQLKKGAEAYGLSAKQTGGSLAALQAELSVGRLPIVLLAPKYFRNSTSNGHYLVVTKIDDQGVHCNDPAVKSGPIVIPKEGFLKGWKARGMGALSIGP